MGDRHCRVVLDDAIHAKQVLGLVDAVGDQPKGVNGIRECAADLHEVVPFPDERRRTPTRLPGTPITMLLVCPEFRQNRIAADYLRTRAIQLIH